MSPARRAVVVFASTLLTSCGDDAVGVGEGTTSTGTTGTSDVESSSGSPPAETSSTAIADESSSSGAPVDVPLEYARGVRLTRLVANQGMQIDLTVDGVDVDPADYPVRFITGRRTLVRAFWSLHASFTPRELVGRLEVTYPDGTVRVDDRPAMVAGVSEDNGPSFQWLLEPDDVRPGMRLRAYALEPDPSIATGELSEPPPLLPYGGAIELPLVDSAFEMEVVLVPVLHQLDGCEQAPVPTEQDVLALAHDLEQNNALQHANVTVGEPMPYTAPIGGQDMGFSPILAALAIRRDQDSPPDNVYYYGLLDSCDGFPGGLLGQALGIPEALPELANQRVATGRWQGSGAAAAETFTHEVGHSQGRRHITCSGGEGGPELDYPHDNGRIGSWGFGIHDFELRPPTKARDYMTYCANAFVSDYGWEKTLDVIETLTGWGDADIAPPDARVLMGIVHDDGKAVWWTARGTVPAEDGASIDARVVWTIEGLEHTTAVRQDALPDAPRGERGIVITAALPEFATAATSVRLSLSDGREIAVDRAALR